VHPQYRINTQEFCKQSGLSATTIWRKSKTDKNFPTAVYIVNKKLWYQTEVTSWIEANEQLAPTHNNLIPKQPQDKNDNPQPFNLD